MGQSGCNEADKEKMVETGTQGMLTNITGLHVFFFKLIGIAVCIYMGFLRGTELERRETSSPLQISASFEINFLSK